MGVYRSRWVPRRVSQALPKLVEFPDFELLSWSYFNPDFQYFPYRRDESHYSTRNFDWNSPRLGPNNSAKRHLRLAQLNDQDSSLKLEFPLAHVATVATVASGQRRLSSVAQVLGSSPALKAAEEWETWVRNAEIGHEDVPMAERTYSFEAILVILSGFWQILW